jgi:predicted nucleic acid-binding protein
MLAEPGIIDANVLAYAFNADDQRHEISRTLLERARDPSSMFYVADFTVFPELTVIVPIA